MFLSFWCIFAFCIREVKFIIRGIFFPIPDDAVDRRKLGYQLLILTVVLGLIGTFIFLLKQDLPFVVYELY